MIFCYSFFTYTGTVFIKINWHILHDYFQSKIRWALVVWTIQFYDWNHLNPSPFISKAKTLNSHWSETAEPSQLWRGDWGSKDLPLLISSLSWWWCTVCLSLLARKWIGREKMLMEGSNMISVNKQWYKQILHLTMFVNFYKGIPQSVSTTKPVKGNAKFWEISKIGWILILKILSFSLFLSLALYLPTLFLSSSFSVLLFLQFPHLSLWPPLISPSLYFVPSPFLFLFLFLSCAFFYPSSFFVSSLVCLNVYFTSFSKIPIFKFTQYVYKVCCLKYSMFKCLVWYFDSLHITHNVCMRIPIS